MSATFMGLWRMCSFLLVVALAGRVAAQAIPQERSETDTSQADDESLASGDCLLSIDGGRRDGDDGRREYYGALSFTSPWGGCSETPRAPARDDAAERPVVRETSSAWEAPPDLALTLTKPASRAKTLDEARAEPPSSEGRVYVVSPRLARDVVAAAWRAAGLSQAALRLGAAADRARWSALLPELRLRGARGFDESARVDYEGDSAEDTRLTGSADVEVEARLTWHLSEVVFSGREPSIERLQHALIKERRDVARATLAALVRWQRAQTRLAAPNDSSESVADAMLDAAEAEIELSVLTDGWFSAKRVRGAPWMAAHEGGARAESRATPVASAEASGAVRPSRGGGEARLPGGSASPSTQASPRVLPREPEAGPDPGEAAAPGVNVPRNVVRDPKHAE
jgi:hypothetical protein